METTELIQIVKEAIAKEFIDWRPLMKRIENDPVDIDSPCKEEGCTLLQWGLENDSNQAAGIAITLGASVNAKGVGKFDCTPLDIAARRRNETYTDMLIRHGDVASTNVISKRMQLLEEAKKARAKIIAASKSESFTKIREQLESTLDVKAKVDKATGFLRFRKLSLPAALGLTGKRNAQLKKAVTAFGDFAAKPRREGATLYCDAWLGASLKKCDLLLAATDSDIDLLTSMASVPNSPLYGNHGLLEPFVELHQQVPFQVLSVNDDAIVLALSGDIGNAKELATNVVSLFPFLRDYHTAGAGNPDDIDVIELVAEDIRDDNVIHIIYHSF